MTDNKRRIRELNDDLRTKRSGGRLVITAGILALPIEVQMKILVGVKNFDKFDADNDPHNEHDFGAFEVESHRVFWKIDYYDLSMKFLSPDPSDPNLTRRVLTVLTAAEY
jgi:hypothetical protein